MLLLKLDHGCRIHLLTFLILGTRLANSDSMRRFARHLLRVLVVVEFLLMLSIARDAAYITTKRLYIGERLDDATQSTAVQRFDIEGSRVVPQIAARTSDHIAFPSPLRWPSRLHVSARPTVASWVPQGGARHWRRNDPKVRQRQSTG